MYHLVTRGLEVIPGYPGCKLQPDRNITGSGQCILEGYIQTEGTQKTNEHYDMKTTRF
jgi:hypothetical protein